LLLFQLGKRGKHDASPQGGKTNRKLVLASWMRSPGASRNRERETERERRGWGEGGRCSVKKKSHSLKIV